MIYYNKSKQVNYQDLELNSVNILFVQLVDLTSIKHLMSGKYYVADYDVLNNIFKLLGLKSYQFMKQVSELDDGDFALTCYKKRLNKLISTSSSGYNFYVDESSMTYYLSNHKVVNNFKTLLDNVKGYEPVYRTSSSYYKDLSTDLKISDRKYFNVNVSLMNDELEVIEVDVTDNYLLTTTVLDMKLSDYDTNFFENYVSSIAMPEDLINTECEVSTKLHKKYLKLVDRDNVNEDKTALLTDEKLTVGILIKLAKNDYFSGNLNLKDYHELVKNLKFYL